MVEPAYFLHIPKTAGTSLMEWLVVSGAFNICPDKLWSALLARSKSELGQYNLFCGHFYRPLSSYLNVPLRTFTFLRNPFDRAISHYRHICRHPDHYFHQKAIQQGSLLAFLRDPVTQPLVRNFQVRSLSAIFDPARLHATLNNGQNYFLERYIETADSDLDDAAALLLAKDFLSRCIFVGIAEQSDESVVGLARALGVDCTHELPRLNTALEPSYVHLLSRAEWASLAELLAADWELYEYGMRVFRDRQSRIQERH